MKKILAIILGKLIYQSVRFLGVSGGSAAPGLISLTIHPNLIGDLITNIPKSVVITGTNGKTTTARLLSHFAKEAGLKVIRNHTGSNLERGIASTLISHFPFTASYFQLGIWELDEAAFNSVAPKIKPDIIVFLNIFRDQLDRYGEVDSVVKNWCQTLKKLPKKTVVLINGDDVNTAKLANCFKGKVISFGVKDYKLAGESLEKKGSAHKLDYEAKDVVLNGIKGSNFQITINHKPQTINIPLPGIYHIYDALAAIICTHLLNLETHRLSDSLKNYSPAFGRVEKLDFGYIFLIKNPAGATQVFETIASQLKPHDRLLLALNDNIADGKDISWIWDADFEILASSTHKNSQKSAGAATNPPQGWITVVSGTRAYDLANRLKYAGFDSKNITIQLELKKALQQARAGLKGRLFILPTYTAMLEIQRILAKIGIKPHYWEEE